MKKRIRNAIVRIDVMDGERNLSRGTGFLVTERLVLTALHVVANRRSDPLEAYPGEIMREFPGHRTAARIYETFFDRQSDWVLLRCVDPPSAHPIPLAHLDDAHHNFETFGFPDANPRDGMVQTGIVENVHAELEGMPAFQLFSRQAAAGDGAPVKGLSGAPVIIDDAVVGVLRFALMKDSRTVAGTLYACPATALVERASDFLAVQTFEKLMGLAQQRRRRSALFSIGAMVTAALLLTVIAAMTANSKTETPNAKPSTETAHEQHGEHHVDRTKIAVLPFKKLSESSESIFVAGMHDEIIENLVQSKNLTVISPASARQYAKQEDVDFQSIGRDLKVGALVDGTVGQLGDRIRIHARLCAVPSGDVLWSQKFDGQIDNVSDLQDQIALKICGLLHVHLSPDEECQIQDRPTDNIEAYQHYLRGNQLLQAAEHNNSIIFPPVQQCRDLHAVQTVELTEPILAKAMLEYEQAIAEEPRFAAALAKLAEAYSLHCVDPSRLQEQAQRAKGHAETALKINPKSPEAHLALAVYFTVIPEDFPKALAELAKASELRSQDSEVLALQGNLFRRVGQWKKAAQSYEAAQELDPVSWMLPIDAAFTHMVARNFEQAEIQIQPARTLHPTGPDAALVEAVLAVSSKGNLNRTQTIFRELGQRAEPMSFLPRFMSADLRPFLRMLDEPTRRLLNDLPSPGKPFEELPTYQLARAELAGRLGESESARKYFVRARDLLEERTKQPGANARHFGQLAVALAGLGEKPAARSAALRAGELMASTPRRDLGTGTK